ncbi:MAG TPA: M20/M25/M40 family metallo-hydrolase [Gaiellaceae bacterium]
MRELVEIESPTGETRALGERMTAELVALGGAVEWLGEHVRADFDGREPPLLLLGHLDTVWQRGTLGMRPFRVIGARAYGPGVCDMKAGLAIALAALRESAGARRAVRVFLAADEEDGSVSARTKLAEVARGTAAALVVEPSTPDGAVKTSRSGLARYRVQVDGSSGDADAHAASAVEELARQIVDLLTLEDPKAGVAVNVGTIDGGTRANAVAEHAEAMLDVRVAKQRDVLRVEAAVLARTPHDPATRVAVLEWYSRPPLERSEGAARLFTRARAHAHDLGFELREAHSVGGSDGNLVGALGIPVLDGLGAVGGGSHAPEEYVVVSSLEARAALLARLLQDPEL